MNIDIHFTEADWERTAANWSAWWAGELERPLVLMEGWAPAPGAQFPPFYNFIPTAFQPGVPADTVLDHYQPYLEALRFYGDAWPRWWPNCGPGVAAAFLGARVGSAPDTVWFFPSQTGDIRDLHLAYDADNPWWRWLQEITRRAVERWGQSLTVCHTDLGGNLDILASLRTTQQLLFDLHDAPDEVARLGGEITRLWLRYYQELQALIHPAGRGTSPWAPLWAPGRCYMLQSDFCYMISPAMFERFVLPDLAACCDTLDYACYHLDGKGEIIHLDQLLALERLRCIQWVPGDGAPPPDEWLPLLKRIRDGGKLCQVFVTARGAQTIVRELGGRGFVLAVGDRMTREEAEDFLHLLAAEDAGTR